MAASTQFFYGDFLHQDKSTNFNGIQRNLVLGPNGRAYLMQETWNVLARWIDLQGGGADELQGYLGEMRQAYSRNGQPCGFAGTNWLMDPARSVGGPVVLGQPGHSMLRGVDGINYLEVTVAIQNTTLFQDSYPGASPGTLTSFEETTSFTDNAGLPIFVERIPQNGLPILQQVSTNSWYFGTQAGSATSTVTWPSPAAALFPGAARTSGNAAQGVTYKSPKMIRGVPVEYTTTWKYEYISATPFLSQLPNTQG